MRAQFVSIYLRFVAIVLSLTALAKLPAVFTGPLNTLCMEDPLFGSLQPRVIPNQIILAAAALTELLIVMLICFSSRRWLPCLASALWGSVCLVARVYFIIAGVDCGCLGWLAKPGPMTNIIAGILALALAVGGFKAFNQARQDSKQLLNAAA